jgi:parallel beta-helix repeat protein
VSHTYRSGGTYTAGLSVRDDDGASSSASRLVSVQDPLPENDPPTAAVSTSCTNLTCTFDASASVDSDGQIVSYTWTFGDGGNGSGSSASHTYSSAGSYSVGLRVLDDDGASDTATQSVTVDDPPDAPFDGVVIQPGQSIQAAVNANPAGTRFLIKAGTHRGQQVQPKDRNEFIGESGALLDGEGTKPHAFRSGADYVVIRNLRITGYVPPTEWGAVEADWNDGTHWTVEGCEIFGNTGAGLKIGHDMVARGNHVHHNGQIGLLGWGDRALIEDNEISYNNTEGHDVDWEAGGMKFLVSDGIVFRNNHVHHNTGIGVWFDHNNINSMIEENLIEDNTDAGIYYEISYRATIRNNVVRGNGLGHTGLSRAGIVISESSDVEVYGNTVSGNAQGITAFQQPRGSGAFGEFLVKNLWVHDNEVTMTSGGTGLGDYTGDGMIFERNNRFDRNTYRIAGNSKPFWWSGGAVTENTWQAAGQDTNGTFIR